MKNVNNIEDLNKILKNKNNVEKDKFKSNISFTITEEIEEYDKLKTKILKFILYKKRSEHEVREKFKDENSEMLEDVICYFKEQKYIDDLSYIERTVNEYIAIKNMSEIELRYKLTSKGVNKKDIDEYFNLYSEKIYEYELNSAKNIISKKMKNEDFEKIKKYLFGKGYKSEIINIVMEELV